MITDYKTKYNYALTNLSDMDNFKNFLSTGVKVVAKFVTDSFNIRIQNVSVNYNKPTFLRN